MILSPPTGITTIAYNDRVVIKWVKNPESDIQGYNVYNSTTSGGGTSGYVKLNNILVETYTEIQNKIISSQQQIQQSGNTKYTTITEQFQEIFVFSFIHNNITEKIKQYYCVAAVNNVGAESVFSIEVEATPLIISTEVVNAPVRTQNDIVLDYITELLERDENLDVKPGSEIRQLHVDPNSREMHFAFVREQFGMLSQSLMSLREIDDNDHDQISDLVSVSTYKQALKEAYYFVNDSDVQDLIDKSFDAISSNYGIVRLGAIQSYTDATFYVSTPPTVDITINLNETISTIPTEIQSAISFVTLSSATMFVSTIDDYYNSITQQYELVIPVQAVNAGSEGNVGSNTINNLSISGLSVTNANPAFGGRDKESNADLADRVTLAFVGLDVGTKYGYKKTCAAIPGVRDVMIITAGDPLMQRDYDEVRHKHVFGKVDIYIRGGENTQTQDDVGFLYKQSISEKFNVSDPIELLFVTLNTSVSESKPIFSVSNMRNASKGQNYDVLGNWQILKNSIILTKTIDVSVDLITGDISFVSPLITGDVIVATYQYKQAITSEVLISSANGGEVSFFTSESPIVKRSYIVRKNGISLIDVIDYSLDLEFGQLILNNGLIIGDALEIDYQYIIYITNETVISNALGGELTAALAHENILESVLVGLDGISLDLEQNNIINSSFATDIGDIVYVTYRYRDSDPILLLTQPAESIVSITGSISGVLDQNTNYLLNKIDDILLEGSSSKANRTVSIQYANGIPIGTMQLMSENIVLINNEYKELSEYGIDVESIIVKQNNTIYLKNSDYVIIPEQDSKKVQIARSRVSSIPNGVEIIASYNHGEILSIVYDSNPLVTIVQDAIDISRHVTADVLVKEVLETKIDFAFSTILYAGSDSIKTISDIKNAISNEFETLQLGQGIAQSDIVRVIESVKKVKSVLIPLSKMVKANGTQINREQIASFFSVYQTNSVVSYTTGQDALFHKTAGHLSNDGFYAIFEDDRPLTLVSNVNDVDVKSGQGFISSDGSIIISTLNSDNPSIHRYNVCYVVHGETGAKDISITSLEYLSINEVMITTV